MTDARATGANGPSTRAEWLHEARSRLASLRLHLDLLERGRPDRREHYLRVLREEVDRLTTVIEDAPPPERGS